MNHLNRFLGFCGTKKEIILLLISGISLLISLFCESSLPFDPAWVSIILCGGPIILEAVIGLVTAFDIKADVLVSLALIASVLIGEYFAAGEVAFIMQLGALLEDLTVARARAGIEKLVHLTPQTARVVASGTETIIPAEQVKVGDILRVLPGETVPVDGVILKGTTSINQAVMTGESLPVDKGEGDAVASGTVNQFGSFDMEAARVGEDSSLQHMIQLVQSADAGKAKIVGIADRWATWVVVVALSAAVLTWLFTHEIIRSVTILVVFCPCALVLATPTAIMAAIGNATKHGFLVREGDALERLASVSKLAFDKTGTLTFGSPKVTAVECFSSDISPEMIYYYAASAELWSEHPLGKAVVNCYRAEATGKELASEQFRMFPGKGVEAIVDNKHILAGNTELLSDHDLSLTPEIAQTAQRYWDTGCTIIFVSSDGIVSGLLALSDTLRPSAADTIQKVNEIGVATVLLTGDHQSAARQIAGLLSIQEVHADCLPEDKLNYIDREESGGKRICMIGDGINDAPALKKAHVGIAMGGVGSDIAVDAADIVLVNDDIKEIHHLIRLSKRMMLTIKSNLTFSMTLNFIAIILAITKVLNPVTGALVHNAGSVFVIINSALLLKWGEKSKGLDKTHQLYYHNSVI